MLEELSQLEDPNLLVGYDKTDDAGVYRLDDRTALVATADVITPPVDDPFVFGQIAAANAISDIYAMGGRPITCLNLIAFPSRKLGPDVLIGIHQGALNKISEAGAVLVGGHTIEDEEPKFGLAVNGLVHPAQLWTNGGARPGDVLILTKPIGSGVLFNANLKNRVPAQAMKICIENAVALNRAAADALKSYPVHAATDVSGFGLAGHLFEMARSSEVSVRINWDRVPVLPEAQRMYERGTTTGMNAPNWERVEKSVRIEGLISAECRELLVDPQTNGGLLAALPGDEADRALRALQDAGVCGAKCIGEVCPASHASISIVSPENER